MNRCLNRGILLCVIIFDKNIIQGKIAEKSLELELKNR
ncbi:hypothetical protein GM3708_1892 [Geminocystis sp. NIES-3708]|nr:hypothetical protein GM3708_1892 [Geminocystis sp. NIES-3708]